VACGQNAQSVSFVVSWRRLGRWARISRRPSSPVQVGPKSTSTDSMKLRANRERPSRRPARRTPGASSSIWQSSTKGRSQSKRSSGSTPSLPLSARPTVNTAGGPRGAQRLPAGAIRSDADDPQRQSDGTMLFIAGCILHSNNFDSRPAVTCDRRAKRAPRAAVICEIAQRRARGGNEGTGQDNSSTNRGCGARRAVQDARGRAIAGAPKAKTEWGPPADWPKPAISPSSLAARLSLHPRPPRCRPGTSRRELRAARH
jgi:hypothetical protein